MSRCRSLLFFAAVLCLGSAARARTDMAVAAVPVAQFTAQPLSGAAPLAVQFTDQSTNSPTSWSWDFGDGGTSSQQNPSHSYTAEGSYTVVLGIGNAFGTDVLIREDYITVTATGTVAPVASFTRDPAAGSAPLTVHFTDTSTNSPTAWAWNFGDGGTSNEQNPTHDYTAEGEYTVVLAASNAVGTNTKVWPACITVSPPEAPVADFVGSPTSGPVPLAVTFTDHSSNAPTSWQWAFGDGGAASSQNPTHTYLQVGSYDVSLTAANSAGSDSVAKAEYVTVTAAEYRADFVVTPTSGAVPLDVEFTDTSTNTPTRWAWSFGDGAHSTEQNPQHTYTDPGCYTVTLSTWDGVETLSVTKEGAVIAAEPVEASFSADPLRGPAPLVVRFTDLSRNGPGWWRWDFGDGVTSTEHTPTHEYTTPGQYVVELMVRNVAGAATARRILTVTEAEGANFRGAPVSGPAPLAVQFTDLSLNTPALWGWDFGDGDTGVTRNPEHTYTLPGRYSVSLTTAGGGIVSSLTRERYILATFEDVPVGYWAINQILACTEAGIVSGYPGGAYRPSEVLTRAAMAVYLARALAGGAVPDGPATPSFSDVPVDHWAYRYVEYVKARDVVRGYPNGYRPNDVVNRAQMAVCMARATAGGDASVPDHAGAPSFRDVTSENEWAWAFRYVEYAHAADIVTGYWDGRYHPERVVTRDQMAVYIARAFELEM